MPDTETLTRAQEYIAQINDRITYVANEASNAYERLNPSVEAYSLVGMIETAENEARNALDASTEARLILDELRELLEAGDLRDEIQEQVETAVEAGIQKRIDAAVAAVLTPAEPRSYTGIAVNVRYGFMLGEDEEYGPSLRCDVNADGLWLLARQTGRQLGRFLRNNNISDTVWIENKYVTVTEDEELGYRLTSVLTKEQKEELESEAAQGVTGPVTVLIFAQDVPLGTRYQQGKWLLEVVDRSTPLTPEHDTAKPSPDYVLVRIVEGPEHISLQAGMVLWWGCDASWARVAPALTDANGYPLYAGDIVRLTVTDRGSAPDMRLKGPGPIKGTLVVDGERVGVQRDDLTGTWRGGGPNGPDGLGSWLIGGSDREKMKRCSERIGFDGVGLPLHDGDQVNYESREDETITGTIHAYGEGLLMIRGKRSGNGPNGEYTLGAKRTNLRRV